MPFPKLSVHRGALPISEHIVGAVNRLLANRCITSAGLVIKAGGSALAKTGAAATTLVVGGVLRQIAAATDVAALAGTVVNATFNVFVYTIDAGGTLRTRMGVAGASLAAVTFPVIPITEAVYGFTIINPTGTGNFVGGTTALDDATVAPNAQHISIVGGFTPTQLEV